MCQCGQPLTPSRSLGIVECLHCDRPCVMKTRGIDCTNCDNLEDADGRGPKTRPGTAAA